MRISDWSSDVCSSDLHPIARAIIAAAGGEIGPGGVRDGRAATLVERDVIVRSSADTAPDGRMLRDVVIAGARAGTIAREDRIDPAAVATMRWFHEHRDRKSGVEGKSVAVRGGLGGRRLLKKKN